MEQGWLMARHYVKGVGFLPKAILLRRCHQDSARDNGFPVEAVKIHEEERNIFGLIQVE